MKNVVILKFCGGPSKESYVTVPFCSDAWLDGHTDAQRQGHTGVHLGQKIMQFFHKSKAVRVLLKSYFDFTH